MAALFEVAAGEVVVYGGNWFDVVWKEEGEVRCLRGGKQSGEIVEDKAARKMKRPVSNADLVLSASSRKNMATPSNISPLISVKEHLPK